MVPLRFARESKGYSQRELGEKVGMDQAAISRAETGRGVTPEQAAQLVREFGFPWDERHFLYPERYQDIDFAEKKAS